MITVDRLKDTYLFQDIVPDFALGRRQHLRYALGNQYACLAVLNPEGPEPLEYLEYAKLDVSHGDLRGAINALGHAKRAVHLTVESFLKILGLKTYTKAKFPEKLEILQALNAFPTRMIGILNRERNLVEHEYVNIGIEEAANFVDIAEMFLLLAYPYLKRTVVGAYVGLEGDERCLEWSLDLEKGEINIYQVASTQFIESPLLGKVHYNMPCLDEDARMLTNVVSITKSNTEEWLPYLDLFVYGTKRAAIRPSERPPDEYEKDGLSLSRGIPLYLDDLVNSSG